MSCQDKQKCLKISFKLLQIMLTKKLTLISLKIWVIDVHHAQEIQLESMSIFCCIFYLQFEQKSMNTPANHKQT